MIRKAVVTVTLKAGVLDPQGKAIGHALGNLGFESVVDVRAGKLFELEIEADSDAQARLEAEQMARKLLANPVIESFKVEIAA